MEILTSDAISKQVRPASRSIAVAGWMAIAAALVVIAGSFGPWIAARIAGPGDSVIHEVVKKGSDGDGWITAGLAIAAVLLLVARKGGKLGRWSSWVAFSLLFLVTAVGIIDWIYVRYQADRITLIRQTMYFPGTLRVGWGLMAAVAGGFIGSALTFVHALLDAPKRWSAPIESASLEKWAAKGPPHNPVAIEDGESVDLSGNGESGDRSMICERCGSTTNSRWNCSVCGAQLPVADEHPEKLSPVRNRH